MDLTFPGVNVDFFDPTQTNHRIVEGFNAADHQGMTLGSSSSYSDSSVSSRRKRNKWADEVSLPVRHFAEPTYFSIV